METENRTDETRVDADQYLRTLEGFFQGEVTGEAMFRSMAEALDDSEHRYQMRVMQQLECETKELLREKVKALGGDTAESATAREIGMTQAKALVAMPRSKFIHIFKREVTKFVARFEEFEKAGPASDAKLLAAVTAHEKALLAFSERESSGASATALDPIVALLRVVPQRNLAA